MRVRERQFVAQVEAQVGRLWHRSEATVTLSRPLFEVLAEFAIDHASDWRSVAGLAPLVAAVLAPEFEDLLSEELRRRLLEADLLPPLEPGEREELRRLVFERSEG